MLLCLTLWGLYWLIRHLQGCCLLVGEAEAKLSLLDSGPLFLLDEGFKRREGLAVVQVLLFGRRGACGPVLHPLKLRIFHKLGLESAEYKLLRSITSILGRGHLERPKVVAKVSLVK